MSRCHAHAPLLVAGIALLFLVPATSGCGGSAQPDTEPTMSPSTDAGLHSVQYQAKCGRECMVTYRTASGEEQTLPVGSRVRPSQWSEQFAAGNGAVLEVAAFWIGDTDTYARLYPMGGGLFVSITVDDKLVVSKSSAGPTERIVAVRHVVE